MAKFLLEAEFDYDFDLLGLVSPLRDYRLCWLINKKLNVDFHRRNDLEINLIQQQKLTYFSIYSYYDSLDKASFFILNNKNNNDLLIPEMKQVDYFFMTKGNIALQERDRLLISLKEVQAIQTLFEVNPLSLKSRQNLIFDESDI